MNNLMKTLYENYPDCLSEENEGYEEAVENMKHALETFKASFTGRQEELFSSYLAARVARDEEIVRQSFLDGFSCALRLIFAGLME